MRPFSGPFRSGPAFSGRVVCPCAGRDWLADPCACAQDTAACQQESKELYPDGQQVDGGHPSVHFIPQIACVGLILRAIVTFYFCFHATSQLITAPGIPEGSRKLRYVPIYQFGGLRL